MKLFRSIVIAGIVVSASLAGQTSDVTPPSLIEFDFNPKSIDVTAGPQTVTVTGRVTDDLSGAFGFTVYFQAPGGGLQRSGSVRTRISGDALDGIYTGEVEIPQFAAAGIWQPSLILQDFAGNRVDLTSTDVADAGLPTDLEVISPPDSTPPAITEFQITPSVIDVSDDDQIVTIDMRVVDDVSGMDLNGVPPVFSLRSKVENIGEIPTQQTQFGFFQLVGGTALDSMWRGTVVMPRYSKATDWYYEMFFLSDRAGNSRIVFAYQLRELGFSPDFTVLSSPDDTTAPQLNQFAFTPSVIDTSSGSQLVTVSVALSDDLSGAHFSRDTPYTFFPHYMEFSSPSGGQVRVASSGAWNLTAGTVLDGTWQAQIFFPQFSEAGTWKASLHQISDRTHNMFTMEAEEIEAAGFASDLVVVRPSLVSDGTIDAGGGTVVDDTFGDQAQVTFPPNAVDGDTEIAIDVFGSPLDVEVPQGFQGIGTNFVNINLTPEPFYPFPAPGVTLVLPLSGPELLPVGFAIPLYYVEPTNGSLQPMLDTSGFQVIGHVDPGQQTATFLGISHFSIVVGLVPDVIPVSIDIKPNGPNDVNSTSKGKIPVAILSTGSFSATTEIDQRTITFGKTGDEASLSKCNGNGEDVDSDGILDLVCHFSTRLTGFAKGDTLGVLEGKTWTGMNIQGSDSVNVVK